LAALKILFIFEVRSEVKEVIKESINHFDGVKPSEFLPLAQTNNKRIVPNLKNWQEKTELIDGGQMGLDILSDDDDQADHDCYDSACSV
jgi:hypothetical protein